MNLRCLIVVPVLAVVAACAPQERRSEIAVERDLVYGRGNTTDLRLDLAMPRTGAGPFPAVIFLHGGGWKAGNRQEMNHFIEGVARLGYVGVTVEYRLAPSARFPAQIEDCQMAVRWLRAHAKDYRIQPDRIGVVGFSAGGHLACLLGLTGGIQAVVSFFGPTDFTTGDWSKDLMNGAIVPFLGGTFADTPEVYRQASPVNYVTKEAPPFLFFHGTEDKLVPVDQSQRLAEKLKSVGVPVRLVVLKTEGHGFSDAANQVCMQQMLDFLNERLRRPNPRLIFSNRLISPTK